MLDFHCDRYLAHDGVTYEASIASEDGRLVECDIGAPAADGADRPLTDLAAEGLPVDIHRHTVGAWDFADLPAVDLRGVDAEARREGVLCVPCSFVAHDALEDFLACLARYSERRDEYANVPAIALEGPLLASTGGTPEATSWVPDEREWEQIASCGPLGLRYCVVSPDALMPHSGVADDRRLASPPMDWIVRTLAAQGVTPAAGHFSKRDPAASAAGVREIVAVARELGLQLLSDHFFNDMPSNIVYAWRTPERRLHRDGELGALRVETWDRENVLERLGEVPRAMLEAVADGSLLLFINFDGEHVDAAISTRLAELFAPHVVAMTDRVDVPVVAGNALAQTPTNGLWYRANGLVAAGSSTIDDQIATLAGAGLPAAVVWSAVSGAPLRALALARPGVTQMTVFAGGRRRFSVCGDDVFDVPRRSSGRTRFAPVIANAHEPSPMTGIETL